MRDIYYVLFRHKWKMVLFFLTISLTVLVQTYRMPEVYRSEAKLLVRLGRENATLDPTVTTGQTINISRTYENEVNLELEILKSRELVENVVDSIGPDAFLKHPTGKLFVTGVDDREVTKASPNTSDEVNTLVSNSEQSNSNVPSENRDKAVNQVIKNLETRALKDSSIISISYTAESPKLAQNVIATLINYYLEKHIAVHQTPGSHKFFLQQANELQNKLTLSENELRKLEDECGISSIEEQQLSILNRITELEAASGAAEAELAACQAKIQGLQNTLSNIPEMLVTQETTGFSDHAIDLMRAKLYELQLEELDLLSKFSEGSQQVQSVREEITEARRLLEKEIAKASRTEVSKGVNTAYTQTEAALFTEQANLPSLKAKVEKFSEQLKTTKEWQKTLNVTELKIKRLKRDISIDEANYRRYVENLEQGRIDRALESEKISNIGVVQQATIPTSPVPQRRVLYIALGFFVGLFGAIGIAIVFEFIDHSIRTPDEVEEKLLMPALASIPRVRINRIRPAEKWTELIKPVDKNMKRLPARWQIPEKIRDHYRIFREELLLKLDGRSKTPHSLAIIGYCHGEGVSTVAANISAMLAQGGRGQVLLVDTNIRYPSAHRIFKTRLEPGLANIPTSNYDYSDIIVSDRFKNLHILAAGTPNGSPPGVLRPAQFATLINSMKKDYRHVVVDMPAMKKARSSARLASLCDAVVLVIEAERLRWEVLLEAKAQLLKWNANTIGVVLNKRRFPIPEWLYRTL